MHRRGNLSAGLTLSVSALLVASLAYGVYRVALRPCLPSSGGSTGSLAGSPVKGTSDQSPLLTDKGGPVRVSTRVLEFGRVPIGFPRTENLFLRNTINSEVEVSGFLARDPFRAELDRLVLAPGRTTGVAITFDPEEPGVYAQRLRLAIGGPVEAEWQLLIRGEGILSPMAAGVPIPPPPDLAIRQQRERDLARLLEEATSGQAGEEEGPKGPDSVDKQDGEGPEGGKPEAGDEGQRGTVSASRIEDETAGISPAIIAAFGVIQNPADDVNNVPAPIPEGEKKPDLPPPEKSQTPNPAGQSGNQQGGGQGEKKQGGGSTGGGSDQEGQGDRGESTGGEETSSEDRKPPTFTVAPNSSLLVHSAKESLPLQTLRAVTSPDGTTFQVEGRIKFPELLLAFGERISTSQFDNMVGSLAPDGSMQMSLTLRLDDPGGMTIDLPVQLTSGMSVGYSSAGRIMFANGIPRDPVTGDFKVVGITNIPMRVGSALEKGAVIVEILGRLEF